VLLLARRCCLSVRPSISLQQNTSPQQRVNDIEGTRAFEVAKEKKASKEARSWLILYNDI
jgi:hypothetical protein